MKKFKLFIVREYRPATEDEKEIPRDEKEIVISAPSCCEAVVLAHQHYPTYLVLKWQEIIEPKVLELDRSKKIRLDPSCFKSNAECRRMESQLNLMMPNKQEELIKKHGWKVLSEDHK